MPLLSESMKGERYAVNYTILVLIFLIFIASIVFFFRAQKNLARIQSAKGLTIVNMEGIFLPFRYDKLFAKLKEAGISSYKIRKDNLISQASLTKMKNGTGSIDTRTLERICALLHCQPGDIMEYVEADAAEPGEKT